MDFFEEIREIKEDFPKVNSIRTEVRSYKFNIYQWLAIGIFIITFFLGIFFGNLFATCSSTSYYSNFCSVREFNFSLMLLMWFFSFLICLFIFAIGHIIALLSEIVKKVSKFSV